MYPITTTQPTTQNNLKQLFGGLVIGKKTTTPHRTTPNRGSLHLGQFEAT
jgi:hypothetical protein